MAETPLVTFALDDRIAVVTLDSPANRNALSGRLLRDLRDQLHRAAGDDTLHGVLLRSSGRVFCAGADLKEAATVDMVQRAREIIALQRDLADLPIPVIAQVDGPVRAGGIGILAACDLVVCRADVTFALTEVRLGLAAATISIPLRLRIAARPLADWLLTGRVFTAAEAASAGLVSTVVDPNEEAMAEAIAAVLADLRAGLRQGIVGAKRLFATELVQACDRDGEAMAELSGAMFHSPVAQAAMRAALPRH